MRRRAAPPGARQPMDGPMLRLFVERLRYWFTYRPERRYMRGGGG